MDDESFEVTEQHKIDALEDALLNDEIYLSSAPAMISRKRSFLLDDVLDSVEGRPLKRRDIQKKRDETSFKCSPLRIKRKANDFDILYSESKSQPNNTPLNADVPKLYPAYIDQKSLDLARVEQSGRGRQLRCKRSMLAMSLERAKTVSPNRGGLEKLDTHEITSFDKILEIPAGFKSEACCPILQKIAPNTVQFNANGKPISPRLLRPFTQAESKSETKDVPRLRHVKSAKDILQFYEDKAVRCPLPRISPRKRVDKENKRGARETALRNGLKNILRR